jgi:hypothetical protein
MLLLDIVGLFLFILDGPEYVTLSPPTTTYTVTEGDTIPSINCTASCRPQCTFMWTGPNVTDGTTIMSCIYRISPEIKQERFSVQRLMK